MHCRPSPMHLKHFFDAFFFFSGHKKVIFSPLNYGNKLKDKKDMIEIVVALVGMWADATPKAY